MAEGEATNTTEVEKFLLDKLQAGIDRKVPYSGKFKKRKQMLENQLKSATNDKEKGKIREKLYLLNDLMNESNSKLDYFNLSLLSSLKQIKKDLKPAEKNGVGDQIAEITPAPALPVEERCTRTMATKEALGLEADELAVKNLLLYQSGRRRDDFNAVGIVGAEGVGKTTLAQSIFAKEEVKKRFLPRIWISLAAEDPAEIAIAERILLALGTSDETIEKIRQSPANTAATTNNQATQPSTSDSNAAAILAAFIHAIRLELMGKRYLIVLDDASKRKEWYKDLSLEVELRPKRLEEKLGFAFPKGSGGAVLVIGWPEKVVTYMVGKEESAIHRLLPLEDPKLCWNICEEEAKGDEEGGDQTGISEEKNRVEDEVVKRANGLPVAARLMGKIRKEKKIQQTGTTV